MQDTFSPIQAPQYSAPKDGEQKTGLPQKKSKRGAVLAVIIVILIIAISLIFLQLESFIKPQENIHWATQLTESVQLSQYPFLNQFGYATSSEQGIDKIAVVSNTSSTTFAALTRGFTGLVWTDSKKEVLSRLMNSYPVTSVVVFGKDNSFSKVMPLPKSDNCCKTTITWLGDRYILAYEFVPPFSDPKATSSPNIRNNFYIGDTSSTSSKIFEAIPVVGDILQKSNEEMNFFPNPDKNLAALSYCLTRIQLYDGNYCSKFGVAIATLGRVDEVMSKDTTSTDNFRIGWSDANLYVQQSNQQSGTTTLHSFSLAPYENDQFVSTLAQHPDPNSKGDPAWSKTVVPIKFKVNSLEFDLDLHSTSTYSRGMLTITLDDEIIGMAYEEQEPKGFHHKTFYFAEKPAGTYILGIRIDPLNLRAKSGMEIKNIQFDYVPTDTE